MSITVSKQSPVETITIPTGGAPEAVPKETEAPAKVAEDFSSDPRMMELARKEKLIRAEAKRVTQEKQELAELTAKARAPQQSAPQGLTPEQWKQKFLEEGPEALGLTYQEVADKYLAQPSEEVQQVKALKQEIERLREEMGQSKQSIEQAKQQAYQNAIVQLTNEAKSLVSQRPEDFETISAMGAYDKVVELIKATYEEEQVLMSVQDAAKEVEDYLLDQALKYASLKKVRAKTAQESPAPQTAPEQTKTRTLTHEHTRSSGAMSARERAIAAFMRKQ